MGELELRQQLERRPRLSLNKNHGPGDDDDTRSVRSEQENIQGFHVEHVICLPGSVSNEDASELRLLAFNPMTRS